MSMDEFEDEEFVIKKTLNDECCHIVNEQRDRYISSRLGYLSTRPLNERVNKKPLLEMYNYDEA